MTAIPGYITGTCALATDRERFLALLLTGPLLKADAIVVLCGEDVVPRADIALQLWKQGAAPGIVFSGGKQDPPRWVGAEAMRLDFLGRGVAPDRIMVEDVSQNTREQAINVVAMAIEKEWKRLLLVASGYHLPRAFLTFLRALEDVDATETIRLVPVPASQSAWRLPPDGMEESRFALLDAEFAKVEEYILDVARYRHGIEYLSFWEGK